MGCCAHRAAESGPLPSSELGRGCRSMCLQAGCLQWRCRMHDVSFQQSWPALHVSAVACSMAGLYSVGLSCRLAKEQSMSVQRKTLVGSGDRSERIRTYNYPQVPHQPSTSNCRANCHDLASTQMTLGALFAGFLFVLAECTHKTCWLLQTYLSDVISTCYCHWCSCVCNV